MLRVMATARIVYEKMNHSSDGQRLTTREIYTVDPRAGGDGIDIALAEAMDRLFSRRRPNPDVGTFRRSVTMSEASKSVQELPRPRERSSRPLVEGEVEQPPAGLRRPGAGGRVLQQGHVVPGREDAVAHAQTFLAE